MEYLVYEFDAPKWIAIAGLFGLVIQRIKRIFEWAEEKDWPFTSKFFAWWAHGKGPVFMSALIALSVVLPGIVEDGKLVYSELNLIFGALGISFSSNLLFWFLKIKGIIKKVKD